MTDPAGAFHPHAPCLSQSTGLRSTRLKDVPPPPGVLLCETGLLRHRTDSGLLDEQHLH